MKSLSEIETTSKRASRALGYSWGISEEVGKSVRLLEMFNFEGIKNLNEYLKEKKDKKFENLNLINENVVPIDMLRLKLSFFGALKFDPKSDKWLRICMFQGAPLPQELKNYNQHWVYS